MVKGNEKHNSFLDQAIESTFEIFSVPWDELDSR